MASETLTKIERALDVVSELCEGKRRWTMSVPARPDDDADIVISGALVDARDEIARLSREMEEARALVCDMAGSCIEFEDERVSYVAVQIDRDVWDRARVLAATPPDTESDDA